jgi:hypothetical protein
MIKVKFLFSGNFDVEGQPRHYEKGDLAILSDEDANRLVVGLIVEVYEEREEVKRVRTNKQQMD